MEIRVSSKKNVHHDPLASFLGTSYKDDDPFSIIRQEIAKRSYPRNELTDILYDYNQNLGNDEAALRQIKSLKEKNSVCVITGQQLGLMGGPSYTILKAISCLLAAKTTGAIPIFWLATEDHDISEIDHTFLVDGLGNLQRFSLSLPIDGHSVEDLILNTKNIEVIKNIFNTLDLSDSLPEMTDSYSETMMRILVSLFKGTGLVFLEPKLLRPLAKNFFKFEIEKNRIIQETLKETTKRLEVAGGEAVLPFEEGSNLFIKVPGGYRKRLRKDGEGFVASEERFSVKELIELIDKSPERFSPNVAARPLLQSSLLPTLAYVAGPSEIAYHRQLGDYFQLHQVPMPCMIPRHSATLISSYAADLLEKCGLHPWEEIPRHWAQLMPSVPAETEEMKEEWQISAENHFGKEIPSEVLSRYVKQGVRKLEHKIIKTQLRKQHLPSNALHFLHNWLHPHEKPQERVLNWWGFQAHSRENLILDCFKQLSWKPEYHLYIFYS